MKKYFKACLSAGKSFIEGCKEGFFDSLKWFIPLTLLVFFGEGYLLMKAEETENKEK